MGFSIAIFCQIGGNILTEKNTPPKYVNGVNTNDGTHDTSSKLRAKMPLINPAVAKKKEVNKIVSNTNHR